MDRRLILYIGGKPAMLASDSLIEYTYERERLTDPAVVKNSYSQSVTLPKCPENDAIFGLYGAPTRRTASSLTSTTGTAFNAFRKLPFEIYNDCSEVVEQGYCRMTQSGDSYSVSLYGGLGEFFYALSYDSAGNKLSLASLAYKTTANEWVDPSTLTLTLNAATVAASWQYLYNGTGGHDWSTYLSFMPAYNGLPSKDFEPSKAIADLTTFENITSQSGYAPLTGANSAVLVDLGDKYTEWEVEDLRAYLQRPCIRFSALCDALSLYTGYSFKVDTAFQASEWYKSAWITLPMPSKDASTVADLLSGTDTPAAYLISYAKRFGLVFRVDRSAKEVTMMPRDRFYAPMLSESKIDLTGRIDRTSVQMTPYPVSGKWYLWQEAMLGQLASDFSSRYAKAYGSMWLDTGFDFEAAQNDVLSGSALKGAPDAVESSPWFISYGKPGSGTAAWSKPTLKFARSGEAKYTLWNNASDNKSQSYTIGFTDYDHNLYGAGYTDFDARVQLHDADNKAIDGSGVLVFFNGFVDTPQSQSQGQTARFHLSDDTAEMTTLAGKACWDLRGSRWTLLARIPDFRRTRVVNGSPVASMEFALPAEIYVSAESWSNTRFVYGKRWSKYMADRLSCDTLVMTCDVDLTGLRVGEGLLSRLYYFENSYWSLNRISNYSLTTEGLTQCEFVKVQDIDAYVNSQTI